jgi:hypothetical protein|tara:strand:- start:8901 stop:9161 length:261 start_codon:yes stop_codon:yes gene_type:complete
MKNSEDINYLFHLENENKVLINNYRKKAKKHKLYFEKIWLFSLFIVFYNFDLPNFILVLILGMISVSYVNSSYLNIPVIKSITINE